MSMEKTYAYEVEKIFTSWYSSLCYFASLGTTLGTGTLTSIILVMLILPQLLYVFDGVINKTYRKRRINIGGGETQTNGGAE